MRATTATKTEVKESSQTSLGVVLLTITFRVAVILTVLVLISISVWAVLAMFGGMISAGDPFTMISEWWQAVTSK